MDQVESAKPKSIIRFRYLFSILCMVGMTVNSFMRTNYTVSAALHLRQLFVKNPAIAKYVILSIGSHFIGMALIAIPAGRMAEIYSAKWTIFTSTFLFASLHMTNPFVLEYGSGPLLVAAKFVDGLVGGALTPAMVVLLARWSPPSERFVMCGITFCGTYFGAAVGYFAINCLSESVDNMTRFIIAGGSAFMYLFFHVIYVHDYPQNETLISKEEEHYIKSSLKDDIYDPTLKRQSLIPWKSIFTSRPFLALFTVHAAVQLVSHVGVNRTISGIDKLYWKEDMNNFTKAVVICSSQFWSAVVALTMGMLFSTLNNQDAITQKSAVKIATTLGLMMPAILLPADFFLGRDWELACKPLMFVTLAGISNMVQANHIELAPNYAGTLLGMTTALGSLVAGLVHSFNPKYEENKTNVLILYSFTASVSLLGMIIYNIFLSCDVQPWNHNLKKLKEDQEESWFPRYLTHSFIGERVGERIEERIDTSEI